MATTLIKNGTVVIADRRGRGRRARSTARRSPRSLRARAGRGARESPPTRVDRRHRQVRDPRRHRRAHPHGAAVRRHRSRPTRSRPARAPRRGAASRRSSTSPCSAPARTCTTASPTGTARPTATARSTTRFHQIIGGVDDESLKAMTYLVDNEGITSFKLFMAYPGVFYSRRRPDPAGDADRRRVRRDDHDARRERHRHRRARRPGARPRRDRPEVPLAHPAVAELEGEATHRAIVLGQGRRQRAAVHRAHVGQRGARRGRRGPPRGPQRVRRDVPAVPLPDARGPPRRSPASRAPSGCARRRCARKHEHHQADLWKGLRMNELAVVSTDHCPFCMKEQKELGIGNFSKIPNGIGGVEHRMELHLPGRRRRRAHARALGRDVLHHAGADVRPVPAARACIAPGADADIVVWDPNAHRPRSASTTSTT